MNLPSLSLRGAPLPYDAIFYNLARGLTWLHYSVLTDEVDQTSFA